ncbi:lysophospholipid acyltransferase family protein [Breoghania sp.]|uniref:lysophospholipid acyltransferase family protein n=1 Tax=Breoghania sp. TaxID=2065378 RepID=UPI0026388A5D|nr:lysophospholipid acyltransferase family protein [Breoghania sp.]MDJ0930253.1 lysophospholipid acyltransferase family protein [Breoghania sp.]
MLKSIGRNPAVLRFVGRMLARYLVLVRKTSSFKIEPQDLYERYDAHRPFILAMWHGQHFMMPFARPDDWDARVMISRSADGEVNAVAAERLGLGLIRASGSQKRRQMRKRGGMRGFFESLSALEEGAIVALTADVPKGPARVAGPGILQLAKYSGCPILPVAIATSRHIDLDTWDRASINLPFSRMALTASELIHVPHDADDETLEQVRQAVETGLDAATARAYELTEKGHG